MCFLQTFLRCGVWATMPRLWFWCLLLSDLASVSWTLKLSVLSTASDATAKMVDRIFVSIKKALLFNLRVVKKRGPDLVRWNVV